MRADVGDFQLPSKFWTCDTTVNIDSYLYSIVENVFLNTSLLIFIRKVLLERAKYIAIFSFIQLISSLATEYFFN